MVVIMLYNRLSRLERQHSRYTCQYACHTNEHNNVHMVVRVLYRFNEERGSVDKRSIQYSHRFVDEEV